MKTLTQILEEMAAKQARLAKVFEEAGPDYDMAKVTTLTGTSEEKAAQIKPLNDELADLGKQRDELLEVQKAAEQNRKLGEYLNEPATAIKHPAAGGGEKKGDAGPAFKSIGDAFVESKAWQEFKASGRQMSAMLDYDDVGIKTLFQTSAGWGIEKLRGPRVELTPIYPLTALDVIPTTTTKEAAIKYMEETTYTNNAAEAAEGGTYGESVLALTERSQGVEKIAVSIPVTDEQLEDEVRVAGYLNNRLPFMLRQRLDGQALVGNGTTPNLRGIINFSGVQTQAKGGDPVFDAMYKGMTKIRLTGDAEPDLCVFHPNDWQDIRLTRTVDGIYILGNPADPGPDRLFGVLIAQNSRLTENTGLVGSFRQYSELAFKRGIEVKISDSHSDFFINGKQMIRADVRCANVVYRPTAFCTITGI